ncbi:MAG: FAD-dependent 5-carboxymethylaminomethyl-2-thiouridine(34) oxidoreductase MnmC [Gammaproteobacteria bacterium]|nr:FAD-dependent 5-carboxymethylaminomethyl-2-thiouridine(34) oxidoreductase MnmC [Gammaproteobacteria bacterium]
MSSKNSPNLKVPTPEKTAAELFTSQSKQPQNIAIIGGGIASLILADHIFKQQPKCNIQLFCQDEQLANKGSGNKQGALYPLLQGSKSVIAEVYAHSYQYAVDYYQSLLEQGITFEHQWCGVLQQAFKPELESRLKKFSAVWPELCSYINAQQSSSLANLPLPFASIYYEKGGWLSPQQLCFSLAEYLSNRFSFTTRLNSKITEFALCSDNISTKGNNVSETKQKSWQLTRENKNGTHDKYQFDAVIICAGHLSARFNLNSDFDLFDAIPLQSVRGQVSRLHNKTELSNLATVLCHKGYVTPAQNDYQSFGATFSKDDENEQVLPQDVERNLEQLQQVYPKSSWSEVIKTNDVIANKAAIRATSPDHIPIVGELFSNDWVKQFVDQNTGHLKRRDKLPKHLNGFQGSDLSGLFTLTGLGARGITTAPLMANHLTSLIFGQNSQLSPRIKKGIAPMRFQVRALKRNKAK